MDAEGLRPDAYLTKVIAAACHFAEQVAGALVEQPPERWRRNTVAAEQVASEEGAATQVVVGAGVSVPPEQGEAVSLSRSRGECVRSGKVARSPPVSSGPTLSLSCPVPHVRSGPTLSLMPRDGIRPNLAVWPRHSTCARCNGKTEHPFELVAKLSTCTAIVANE
jgi:hypothetical protein